MKKLIIFILMIAVILGTYSLMVRTDYNRAKADKPPKFAIRTAIYKDGGTTIYKGFGYKVIDYNEINGRQDVVFIPFYKQN